MKKITTNANTFADLIANYNQVATAQTDKNSVDYVKALQELATACAYSVLKKCINVSYNDTLVKVRRDLARALHDISATYYTSTNAYTTDYTTSGEQITVIADKDLHNALTKLCAENFGDGLDLVNTAVVAILEQTAEQKQRDPEQPIDLERLYTKRQLKRKVWIKTADSIGGWETVETTPIQEIYRAVRRAIQSEQPTANPRNGYTYIEDLATDPETDIDITIYRRLGKYADLGGAVTDYNGQEYAYTVDPETVVKTDTIIAKLNLTTRQAVILSLRQSGYGYKAIATHLGISDSNVKGQMAEIKRKARIIGLCPAE